jgi:glutamate N-acetyltransferase/amino-acid N-acetyltransferase
MLPKGFIVNGSKCGLYKNRDKQDIALFYSTAPCEASGMFTSNLVKAAPVLVSMKNLKKTKGSARAIIANSGGANCSTGARGLQDAAFECSLLASELGIKPEEALVASTGVIGQFLPMVNVIKGIDDLSIKILAAKSDELAAARAIMTTDTRSKIVSKKVLISGKAVTVWGTSKGSGMMHPTLKGLHATMFAFVLTDALVEKSALNGVLTGAVEKSFNCISVDGDTSTNDTVILLANGLAENKKISKGTADYVKFSAAVETVCVELAKMMAADGEGATKFVEIEVKNAASQAGAKKIAETIATSPLVKTAMFGNDANWGRIIAAAGRAGVNFNPDRTEIRIGNVLVFKNGMPANFSEVLAKKTIQQKKVKITVDLKQGKHRAAYYTCDFSFDYVKINASYRS